VDSDGLRWAVNGAATAAADVVKLAVSTRAKARLRNATVMLINA